MIAAIKDSSLRNTLAPFLDDTSQIDSTFPYCFGIQVKALRMETIVVMSVTTEKPRYYSFGENSGSRSHASIMRVVM
ncbi:MAG: hypothetical protein JW795_19115 [Chitinivibrionales bacterium]|nr:hypothetical protein [Chitinivibrionales bacterium]